jgi:hypothetical protein
MPLKMDIVQDDRFFMNSDYEIDCYIKQADQTTAQDVSGWSLSWMLKKRESDADASAVITKTTAGGGITIENGPLGYVRVLIADTDTQAVGIRAGVYMHELKRTDAGLEAPVIKGMAVLRPSLHLT